MSYPPKVTIIYPLRLAIWFSGGLLFFLLLCATPVKAGDWIYTFRPGDNLWNFTRAYLKSPSLQEKLRKYNKIPVADYVPMGTELRIPVEWLSREPAPAEVLFIRGKSYVMHPSESAPASVAVGDLLKIGD
ncbi:MAG: LysM peptidoglycan-binding domain-containing protein, partial [Sedimenticola sp.]